MNPLYKPMYNDLIIKKLVVCSEIFKKMQNHQMEGVKTQCLNFSCLVCFQNSTNTGNETPELDYKNLHEKK